MHSVRLLERILGDVRWAWLGPEGGKVNEGEHLILNVTAAVEAVGGSVLLI